MRRALFALVAFIALSVGAHAAAPTSKVQINPRPFVPTFFRCYNPATQFQDGCANAPAPQTASFQIPNFFTGYANTHAGTSADYSTTRPSWAVACVDYKCANYTPVALLTDITAYSLPPSCSIGTGTFGDPQLNCTNGGTFQHVYFGGAGGRNGGKCVSVNLSGTAPYVFDDFYVDITDGNCAVSVWWLNAAATPQMDVTLTNFYANGRAVENAGLGKVAEFAAIKGKASMSYFAIQNFAGRPFSFNDTNAATGLDINFFYIEDLIYRPFMGHGEYWLGSPAAPDFRANHNTIGYGIEIASWQGTSQGQTANFPATNGPITVDHFEIHHVGVIEPNIGGGGRTVTFTGCKGADETCTTNGNNFYLHSLTVGTQIGKGQQLPIACNPAAAAWLYQKLSGPGGSGPNAYLESWSTDGQLSTQAAPNLIMTAGTCNGSMGLSGGGSGQQFTIGVMATGVLNGTISLHDNYGDFTSQAGTLGTGQVVWQIVPQNTVISVAGSTVSGTSLALGSSQTLTTGQIVYGSGITGCVAALGGAAGCPTIAAGGTGTLFTITPPSTLFSGTVQIASMSVCPSPVDFHGNYDLTGVIPSLNMNQINNYGTTPWWVSGC